MKVKIDRNGAGHCDQQAEVGTVRLGLRRRIVELPVAERRERTREARLRVVLRDPCQRGKCRARNDSPRRCAYEREGNVLTGGVFEQRCPVTFPPLRRSANLLAWPTLD